MRHNGGENGVRDERGLRCEEGGITYFNIYDNLHTE